LSRGAGEDGGAVDIILMFDGQIEVGHRREHGAREKMDRMSLVVGLDGVEEDFLVEFSLKLP